MAVSFPFSHFCCFLLVMALFRLCLSDGNLSDVLCTDEEREALVEFKQGLIDKADRLGSWDAGKKTDCCNWVGIVCDNSTGHVQKIHLPGNYNCHTDDVESSPNDLYKCLNKRLSGNLSASLMHLKQLKHLDLSNNNFGGIEIPGFIGSLGNLRYLNLSRSGFGGTIPPELGNLTELHILCLGSFYTNEYASEYFSSMRNMHWLSSLRGLRHLDMSEVDLREATDWLQVINTLPSLVELHLSSCKLPNTYPHVSSLNLTSLAHLDLSNIDYLDSSLLQWAFSINTPVSLDLSWCDFQYYSPSIDIFRNSTSLESLYVHNNHFMNSSLVLKGLSSIGSNLVSLDISGCAISSSVLRALHNLTSLLNLDLSENELTETIPKSLANLCNLRHIDLEGNHFPNISLTSHLQSFLECKKPLLESLFFEFSGISGQLPYEIGHLTYLVDLQLQNNLISGPIPYSIGRLSSLKSLDLQNNILAGPIPYSFGRLSSLEWLDVSDNQLNGSLPDSLGQLSKLEVLDFFNNLLTGVVTKSHLVELARLKVLRGGGNKLTLRSHLANWIPSLQLWFLDLSCWDLGPQFPSWLQVHTHLKHLDISKARISSLVPDSFFRSFPNLRNLDMSHNHIQGILPVGIATSLEIFDVSSNDFGGQLPQLSNSSSAWITLL